MWFGTKTTQNQSYQTTKIMKPLRISPDNERRVIKTYR